jgi:hypothetical protein
VRRRQFGALLLVLGVMSGCPAPRMSSAVFTRAVVERPVYEDGRPVFDASGMAKLERKTFSDPDTVRELASFFPGVGQGKESRIAGGWKAGYWVKFDRADGSTVNVTVNPKATTWSETRGDWDAEPGLKEFLDRLFTE